MAELTINGLIVKKLSRKDKISNLIKAALAQSTTGNPLFTNLSYTDAQMHGFGTSLQIVDVKFNSNPPLATKAEVTIAVDILVDAHGINGSEIQGVARTQAKADGNVAVGINIILKAGYLYKSPKAAMENAFDAQPDGPNAIIVTTKAVAKSAVYIRMWAKVSAKGVIPTVNQIRELLISRENDIRLEDLESAGVYAFCEATILPISRKSDSGTPTPQPETKATPSKATKAHRRTYSGAVESNYEFGPWIWVVVQ